MPFSESSPTVGFFTLGCRVNHYESEALLEELRLLGAKELDFSEVCDVYVINTCAVTEESVRKSRQMVRSARKRNPNAFIAVCGCASQLDAQNLAEATGADFVCGTRNKLKVIGAIKDFLEEREPEKTVVSEEPCGDIEKMSISSFGRTRAYIKIQDGCNGKCSYCVIPHVRGRSVSKKAEDVLSEVKKIAENGIKEIVFTGIETSDYSFGLAELVEAAAEIDGIERIRLGSLEPSTITPEFVEKLFKTEKFMPHLHLSLQSGSSRILAKMKRRYNADMIMKNVDHLKKAVPGIQLSADIIVGFPGETDEDFEETLATAKRIGLLHAHIFTYSPRPGTEAAQMKDQLPKAVKSERAARLSEACEKIRDGILEDIISRGEPVQVLAEQVQNGIVSGHAPYFAEVKFPLADLEVNRGDLISVVPERIEDGVIFGKAL